MLIGAAIVLTDEMPPAPVVGGMVEGYGFESLFVSEHTHIPKRRTTPYPGQGDLPLAYARTLDPFVALSAISVSTKRLRLGTGVCLLAQRDAIITAKAVASLDVLSGGRVEFGVGAGWMREEAANHGVDFAQRFSMLEEKVRAIRTIWRDDEATFNGDHVRFDAIWSWPKPLQKGGPPIWIGGNGEQALQQPERLGVGWMPRVLGGDRHMLRTLRAFQQRCESSGNPELPVTLYNAPYDPAALERYRNAGVYRALLRLPSGPLTELERRLDEAAPLIQR